MPHEPEDCIARAGVDGSAFLLFPAEPNDYCGKYVVCWDEQGGHCGADYLLCIARSKPASREIAAETAETYNRIASGDCVVRPVRRRTKWHRRLYAERLAELTTNS